MSLIPEHISKSLEILNQPYASELTTHSARIEMTSPHLKIPLRAHQAAAVNAMVDQEIKLSKGWDMSGEILYGSWSILGDGVGVGKSLTVLSHIAYLKSPTAFTPNMMHLTLPSSFFLYSMEKPKVYDMSQCDASLIIVPHTLFRQWSTYIKEQSNLKCFLVTTKTVINSESFHKKIMDADVILLSNTLYGQFLERTEKTLFKRAYIDEADSIYIPGTRYVPIVQFIWLISASWPNLLFPNRNLWVGHHTLATQVFGPNSKYGEDFREQFRSIYVNNTPYYSVRYTVTSDPFMRRLISPNHHLRGHLVIRSSTEFIKESISLPALYRHVIICRAPASFQLISNVISADVRNLLHAGDTATALQILGVPQEQTVSLVQAVTENRKKELHRLKLTYDYKERLDYATPQAKEAALLSLKQKIAHLEEQILSIKERIENFQQEICPICFDEPTSPLLTHCCQRIFCAACILQSLTRNVACPLCRTATKPSELKQITDKAPARNEIVVEETHQPPLKRDALLSLFKENPKGKFLVFSRYDNSFTQIGQDLTDAGISTREVKGTKDVINSILKSFQAGEIRCLFLNSVHAGAGLTITAATHVVLLHSMQLEEEKQILGRAYRLGRKEALNVYKLVHPDEMDVVA